MACSPEMAAPALLEDFPEEVEEASLQGKVAAVSPSLLFPAKQVSPLSLEAEEAPSPVSPSP